MNEMEAIKDAEHHKESVADSHEAYTQFKGWILSCLWCEFRAVGKTKHEAFHQLKTHYDAYDITIF